jgi:hypothetical protein
MPEAHGQGWRVRPRVGESARSIVYLNAAAVTTWSEGGETPKPGLILNVKVRPSGDTAGQVGQKFLSARADKDGLSA